MPSLSPETAPIETSENPRVQKLALLIGGVSNIEQYKQSLGLLAEEILHRLSKDRTVDIITSEVIRRLCEVLDGIGLDIEAEQKKRSEIVKANARKETKSYSSDHPSPPTRWSSAKEGG